MRKSLVTFILLCVVCIGQASAAISQPSKSTVLQRLSDLQSRQRKTLEELDRSSQKVLASSKQITIKDLADSDVAFVFETINEQTQKNLREKEEFLKRMRFIDQLLLQVDSRYTTQNLREFLSQTFLEMAETELGLGSPLLPSDSKYSRFLVYASVAIRELPEPIEDIISFFEAYLSFSSILNPKPPQDFFMKKNYSNGSEFEEVTERIDNSSSPSEPEPIEKEL